MKKMSMKKLHISTKKSELTNTMSNYVKGGSRFVEFNAGRESI